MYGTILETNMETQPPPDYALIFTVRRVIVRERSSISVYGWE